MCVYMAQASNPPHPAGHGHGPVCTLYVGGYARYSLHTPPPCGMARC